MEIEGMTAVVTGGASGLGASTATMLAGHGAQVAILDIDEERGFQVAQDICGLFVAGSVADEVTVANAFQTINATLGVARILVNCAGIAPSIKMRRHNGMHPLDAFQATLETNLVGTFLVIREFIDRFRGAEAWGEDQGVIINTTSIAAFEGHVGQVAYAASKAGVVGMTLPLARELCANRIRVMTIAPGLFDTAMLASVPGTAELATQVPHPSRLGRPKEFAQLVESIIRNPMLNGEVIRLDAGLRLAPH